MSSSLGFSPSLPLSESPWSMILNWGRKNRRGFVAHHIKSEREWLARAIRTSPPGNLGCTGCYSHKNIFNQTIFYVQKQKALFREKHTLYDGIASMDGIWIACGGCWIPNLCLVCDEWLRCTLGLPWITSYKHCIC